jgi:hypothetical protein
LPGRMGKRITSARRTRRWLMGSGSNANGILDQAGSATQPDETAPDGSGSTTTVERSL